MSKAFPVRSSFAPVRVEGIKNFDNVVEVAQRLWVAATAIRDRGMCGEILLSMSTAYGQQYVSGDRDKLFNWLRDARAAGFLIAELGRLSGAGRKLSYLSVWKEAHPGALDGNPFIEVYFPKAAQQFAELEDSTRAVLWEHNSQTAQLLRQSAQSLRPAKH